MKMPGMHKQPLIIVAILACLLTGCATVPIALDSEPVIVEADLDHLWQQCQSELKNRGFSLDQVNLRSGIIETFPLVSRQWFEFWHRDTVTAVATAEASLHTIRRSVRMELSSLENSKYQLQCRVDVERLSLAPSVVSGSVQAQDVFSGTAGQIPIDSASIGKSDQNNVWIPLARDGDLEKDILTSITRVL